MKVQPESFGRISYRADIDGLRAVAIISVLIFHLFPNWLPGGFIGVDIFFVISGYLISRILFKGLTNNTFSFFDFYARRVRRIFPAVILVVLVTSVLAYLLLTPYEYKSFVKDIPYAAFFLENYRLYTTTGGYWDISTELKPLMHFWSLAVEEQYYIIYPLLALILWKAKQQKSLLIGLLVVGLFSFLINLYDAYHNPTRAFFSLHCRFWELSIGGIYAAIELNYPSWKNILYEKLVKKSFYRLWNVDNLFSLVGLSLIIVALIFLEEGKYYPGFRALLPTLGALILIISKDSYFNVKVLSNRAIVFIGLLSYPLYLWHWPLISLMKNNLTGGGISFSYSIIILFLSFILAYLTYEFIERPIRTQRANFKLVFTLVVSLILSVCALLVIESKSRDYRMQQLPKAVYDVKRENVRGSDSNCKKVFGSGYTVCRSIGSRPSILLMGDSHAYWLWNAIKDTKLNNLFVVANAGATVHEDAYRPKYAKHTKRTKIVWDEIRQNKDISTVILAGFWEQDASILVSSRYKNSKGWELFVKHWHDTLRELERLNKNVIIVLDNPTVSFNPLDSCFKTRLLNIQEPDIKNCKVSRNKLLTEKVYKIRNFFIKLSLEYSNVKIIDSWDGLCDLEYCYLANQNASFYRDSHHLSTNGSMAVWRLIENAIVHDK